MITISDDLIMTRAEQIEANMTPPSGALLTWKAMFEEEK